MRACVNMHTMADPDGQLLSTLDKRLPERAVGMTAAAVAESSGSLAHLLAGAIPGSASRLDEVRARNCLGGRSVDIKHAVCSAARPCP
jgi:hypothetical protein